MVMASKAKILTKAIVSSTTLIAKLTRKLKNYCFKLQKRQNFKPSYMHNLVDRKSTILREDQFSILH
jgi:hypothetical protein